MLRRFVDTCTAAVNDKELCERAVERALYAINNNRIEYVSDTAAGRVVFVTAWRYNFDTLDINVDMDNKELVLAFEAVGLPALIIKISKQKESVVMASSEYYALRNTYDPVILNIVKNIIVRRRGQ